MTFQFSHLLPPSRMSQASMSPPLTVASSSVRPLTRCFASTKDRSNAVLADTRIHPSLTRYFPPLRPHVGSWREINTKRIKSDAHLDNVAIPRCSILCCSVRMRRVSNEPINAHHTTCARKKRPIIWGPWDVRQSRCQTFFFTSFSTLSTVGSTHVLVCRAVCSAPSVLRVRLGHRRTLKSCTFSLDTGSLRA